MNKIILKIGGMSCSACSVGLEKHLNKQKGIENATVNLVLAQAKIEYTDDIEIENINKYIEDAGFKSLGVYDGNEEEDNKSENLLLILFSILSIIILYVSMPHMIGLPVIPIINLNIFPVNYSICLFILTIPYLFYGFDIFKSGFKNLFHKTPNMDTLVTLGVIASFIYSTYSMIMVMFKNYTYVENLYFESSAIVIYFIKLGRYIDLKSKKKTREAIKQLVQITPTMALLKLEDREKEITIDEVKKGDILIAKPGMKIAVDGVIINGQAHFDESFITGESILAKKCMGDNIVAGSINHDGYIEYKAEKIGANSTISEIVRLVVEATNTKAPIARLADQVSSYFVPIIILISVLTLVIYILLGFEISEAIISFVTVLVVACPCALGLATPLAIVVSEGLCAKNGILVKSSEILENVGKVDTIVFDKTGTLTYGNLRISKILNYSNYTDDELILISASIEKKSTHPISKAFLQYTNKFNLKLKNVTNFENIPGIGLKGTINRKNVYIGNNKLFKKLKVDNKYMDEEKKLSNLGNSIVYVFEDKNIIGIIGVCDIIRADAKDAILCLQKMKKDIIMLTGDNEITAKIIAKELNINEVIADVLPSNKTDVIKRLIKSGKNVMMIGDGINDAPSLVNSNVGVSINSGTDIANDSSDVILMNDDLQKTPLLIKISKQTLKNIKQNLFWAFFYNICMIPIAVGILKPFHISMSPMFAGLAMMISSLTVVFNTLRLKKIKLEKSDINV